MPSSLFYRSQFFQEQWRTHISIHHNRTKSYCFLQIQALIFGESPISSKRISDEQKSDEDMCEHTPAHTRSLLTTCLYSWAVGVSQSNQCRLYQLCEGDIFTNQHKLSMMVAVALTVSNCASIFMLHHTVDWDHQTWQTNTERCKGKESWAQLELASVQVFGVEQGSCDLGPAGVRWTLEVSLHFASPILY